MAPRSRSSSCGAEARPAAPPPRGALAFLLCAAVLIAGCRGAGPSARAAGPFPAPERPVARIVSSAYSDEATRDRHHEADRVLDRLHVRPGVRAADLGAGDGYYTVRLARRLGPAAVVYAEDVVPEHLKALEARLAREGIATVTVAQGTPGDPKLPPGSIDVAILSHMYHEIENPFEFLYRLRPALRPGARVGIIDADRPTQDHGTPPSLLRCELAAVGYRQTDFLRLDPPETYLAVFAPPDALPPVQAIRPCRP